MEAKHKHARAFSENFEINISEKPLFVSLLNGIHPKNIKIIKKKKIIFQLVITGSSAVDGCDGKKKKNSVGIPVGRFFELILQRALEGLGGFDGEDMVAQQVRVQPDAFL